MKDIRKRHLRKRYAKPSLKDLTVITIDEMYLGKVLGYRTMVLDHVAMIKFAFAVIAFKKMKEQKCLLG